MRRIGTESLCYLPCLRIVYAEFTCCLRKIQGQSTVYQYIPAIVNINLYSLEATFEEKSIF